MQKHILLLLATALVFTSFGCSNDDDDASVACLQANWVGEYEGTCGDRDVVLIIAASGTSDLDITLSSSGGFSTTITGDVATPEGNGCRAVIPAVDGDAGFTFTLDGDNIAISGTDGDFNPLSECNNSGSVTRR